MKKQNPVRDKSYSFAVSIVKLYKQLKAKNEFVLARQILRSGTSIGANVEEAIGARSKRDFLTKINIAYKEARETKFWVRLLTDTGYLEKSKSSVLLLNIEELLKLLGTIQKSIKRNQI